MIQLLLELEDVDYDALIEQLLPQLTEQLRASGNPVGMLLSNGMTSSMASKVLHSLSQEKKEGLLADLINGNQARLVSSIESAASQRGVSLHVVRAQAEAK